MLPKKYVKNPVEIEALEFVYSRDGINALRLFAPGCIGVVAKDRLIGALGEAEIGTLEDGTNLVIKHIATEGDFIIRGVQGEFYACKPQIFHQTYTCIQ